MDPPDRCEQQRHSVLRHRVGGIRGDMHHMDFAERGLDVHIVVARGAQRDQPDAVPVQFFDHCGVHRVVDEHADGIAAPGQRGGVRVQLCFKKAETQVFQPAVTLKGRLVIGFRVEKSGCNHFPLPMIHRFSSKKRPRYTHDRGQKSAPLSLFRAH